MNRQRGERGVERLVRYSIRYSQRQNGCWTGMEVRLDLRELLAELEPEKAVVLRERIKEELKNALSRLNNGSGPLNLEIKPWADFLNQLDSQLEIKLVWPPGVLPCQTRFAHLDQIEESVKPLLIN